MNEETSPSKDAIDEFIASLEEPKAPTRERLDLKMPLTPRQHEYFLDFLEERILALFDMRARANAIKALDLLGWNHSNILEKVQSMGDSQEVDIRFSVRFNRNALLETLARVKRK